MARRHFTNEIIPRENLDFGLDTSVPRFWWGGNPYKTRLFDSMQSTFPDGERYFIASVVAFRKGIDDPALAEDVRRFSRQEGQHGLVHEQYNRMIEAGGVPLARIIAPITGRLKRRSERFSPEFNVALTAAAEHFTAMMAECFFDKKWVMADADHRMRALLAWHAIEEMEHRAVAFDVMQKVAKVGYVKRAWAILYLSRDLIDVMFRAPHAMMKADGLSARRRWTLQITNIPWLVRLFGPLMSKAGAYLVPGFHPLKQPPMRNYAKWLEVYARTGDPLEAAEALAAAAA
ncbi:metal-dependent hydrolase [Zavarzinia compransoris]|uniref:metal-dependent hydrolase n=1 Tax=Zavarzinia marina TaxID=2911065 RepID=UPI001F45911C|nr:metal-dependent hydrolase [Zavarzinia marina]MCF4167406.1 metal-dependent hydrolase [Zavarzinia marina]